MARYRLVDSLLVVSTCLVAWSGWKDQTKLSFGLEQAPLLEDKVEKPFQLELEGTMSDLNHTLSASRDPPSIDLIYHYTNRSTTRDTTKDKYTTTLSFQPSISNLRLAFLGDSVCRFQYLTLVHYLAHGHWPRDDVRPNFVISKDFANWNNFTRFSNARLNGMEHCDCDERSAPTKPLWISKNFENRYFRDPQSNNYVTFIKKFGSSPSIGHWSAPTVYQQSDLHFDGERNATWVYNWTEVIRNHIAQLIPRPDYLVMNQGLWVDHGLNNPDLLKEINQAIQDVGMIPIWKTTTKKKGETSVGPPEAHDVQACQVFGNCMNLSWTADKKQAHYWDRLHFTATTNQRFNQQLLELLVDLHNGRVADN